MKQIGRGEKQIQRGEGFADRADPYFFSGLEDEKNTAIDLRNFYRPLATGDRSAIDAFLSPERRAINQGYQSVQNNIAQFAPRGGGRVAAGINADVQRQGQLSDLVFNARRTGAQGLGQVAGLFGDVAGRGLAGVGQGDSRTGTGFSGIGQGLGAIGQAGSGSGNLFQMLSNSQNQANVLSGQAAGGLGQLGGQLGGLLAGLFGGKGGTADKGIGNYSPGGYTDLKGIFTAS